MNGAGNDFVVIDNRSLDTNLSREQIALLCDRQRGVGADGISSPEQAAEVAAASDGVVVGSAIVNQVAQNADKANLAEIVRDFTAPLINATKNRN